MKHFHLTKSIFVFVLLAIIGFVATKIVSDKRFSSPLTPDDGLKLILSSESNCTVPCWQGISPGLSNEEEFLAVVDTLPANRFRQLRKNEISRAVNRYSWIDKQSIASGEALTSLNIVTELRFWWAENSAPSGNLVLDLLGSPDAYTASTIAGHTLDLVVTLFYEKGIVVTLHLTNIDELTDANMQKCEFDLIDNIPVWNIILLKSGRISFLSQRVNSSSSDGSPHPWAGFTPITLTSPDCNI